MIAHQLSIDEALEERELGMAVVILRSQVEYRERVKAAIAVLADGGAAFSSDDIRREAGDTPVGCSPNLIGALVNSALRQGLIHQVGYTRSGRVIGHGNRVGLYCGAEAQWP